MSDVLDLINQPTLDTQGKQGFTDSTFSTRGEVFKTQAIDTILNQNFSSKQVSTALGIDDFRKSFNKELGMDLDRAVYEDQIATLKAEGKQFRDLGYIPEADQDSIKEYVAKNKDKIKGLDTFASIDDRAKNFALDAKKKAQETYQSSPDGLMTGIASFGGGFAGSVVDPVNISSMAMGAGAGLSLMRTVALEAGINAGVEVAIQPFVYNWQKEIGAEYTFGDAALNVGFAALFGGLFGGASKLISGSPNAKIKMADIPDAPTPPPARQTLQIRDFTNGDTLGAIEDGVQRAIYKGITIAYKKADEVITKSKKIPIELKTGRAEGVRDFKVEMQRITEVKDQKLADLELETKTAIDALDNPSVREEAIDQATIKNLPRKQKKKLKKVQEQGITPEARAKAVAEFQKEYEVRAREIVNEYNQEAQFYIDEQVKFDQVNSKIYGESPDIDYSGMSKAYILQRAKSQAEKVTTLTPEQKVAFDVELRRAHSDDFNIHRDSPELNDGKHQAALLEVDAALREGRPLDPAKIDIPDEEFLSIDTTVTPDTPDTPPLKAERLKAIKEMQDLISDTVESPAPARTSPQAEIMWVNQRDGNGVMLDSKGNEIYFDSSVSKDFNNLKRGDRVYYDPNPQVRDVSAGRNIEKVAPPVTRIKKTDTLPNYTRTIDDEFFGDAPPQVSTNPDKYTQASERAREVLSPANVAARRAELEADLAELGDGQISIDGETIKASDYLKELKKADDEITALEGCKLK